MQTQLIDTSQEFRIYQYKQGIVLVKPDIKLSAKNHRMADTGYTVGDIMQFSFNTYFMNLHSELQNGNQHTIQTMGFDSLKNGLCKTVSAIIKPAFAQRVKNNDLFVINHQRQCLFDEAGEQIKDGPDINAFSLKMPWYDLENNVIGTFGFGVVLGIHSVSESMKNLLSSNLLTPMITDSKHLSGIHINQQYFSYRETTILRHVARGKTAREIGNILNISMRTVEHYIEKTKHKLGVSKKSELIDKIVDYFI